MKISYCICTWNEHLELTLLLKQLVNFIDLEDEIIIQGDQGKVTDEVVSVVRTALKDKRVSYLEFPLKKDFATFKNNVLKQAKGDYIFLIDPDEILHPNLLLNLKGLLAENPDVDVFAIPRFNHVIGLTSDYAQSQNWKVNSVFVKHDINVKEILDLYGVKDNEIDVVNPWDWQSRIFKNHIGICYSGAVHEKLLYFSTYSGLPVDTDGFDTCTFDWCIFHVKQLDRQIKQNKFYSTIS